MAKEAFSVGLEAAAYHRKPIEGDPSVVFAARERMLRNDILRYLGEYRLAVKFDEIYYCEGQSSSGERYLRAEEDAPIKDRYRNFVSQKEREGLDTRREVAECLGFEKIEEKFLQGDDFLFLWISPPGRKEDGYGNYSFTFVGEVKNGVVREIPYRNELGMQKHNEIAGLFTNRQFYTDVDFLANPVFIERTSQLNSAEDILAIIGEKEAIDTSWRSRLETRLASLMDSFVEAVKRNASEHELDKIKRAIENFTIDKKDEIKLGGTFSYDMDVRGLIDQYGSYAPPVVGGSCGSSSSSVETLMDFQNTLNLEPDEYGDRTFECPECGKTNIRPKNQLLKNCQHCGTNKVAC